jgi:HTH-type transcriptional regulator/antitoxin HigA
MITNERQYKITKNQLIKMNEAINSLKSKKLQLKSDAEFFANVEIDALLSEKVNLEKQILEYEKLKSGIVNVFKGLTLAELPKILIEARIAKNLSQHKLAALVGVKEQQIQRYEAQQYSVTSFARISKIAEVLELNITEVGKFKI